MLTISGKKKSSTTVRIATRPIAVVLGGGEPRLAPPGHAGAARLDRVLGDLAVRPGVQRHRVAHDRRVGDVAAEPAADGAQHAREPADRRQLEGTRRLRDLVAQVVLVDPGRALDEDHRAPAVRVLERDGVDAALVQHGDAAPLPGGLDDHALVAAASAAAGRPPPRRPRAPVARRAAARQSRRVGDGRRRDGGFERVQFPRRARRSARAPRPAPRPAAARSRA